MIVTGIQCPSCGDKVWSRHQHDLRWCKCGEVAVDGGRIYTRVLFKDKQPKQVQMEVGDGKEPE